MYERDKQTDRQTDSAWQHRPRLHSIARQLLKLTAASNAGVYEKLTIVDEDLVDDGWMLTRDHHLDNRLSLSHVSRRWRRQPHVGAVNDVYSWVTRPRMSGQLYMTQVAEYTSTTNCQKSHSPIWTCLKISPPQVSARDSHSVPGQKIHTFPYRGLPWGLLSHAISADRADFKF